MAAAVTRADVVAAGRTWVDTPYRHQARLREVGVDCIGLEIGVARALGLVAPEFDITGYARTPDGSSLMLLAELHMVRVPEPAVLVPGMVIVVAIDADPQHFGILGDHRHGVLSIIHANAKADPPRVVETRLMFTSTMRLVAAFDLPGVVP